MNFMAAGASFEGSVGGSGMEPVGLSLEDAKAVRLLAQQARLIAQQMLLETARARLIDYAAALERRAAELEQRARPVGRSRSSGQPSPKELGEGTTAQA